MVALPEKCRSESRGDFNFCGKGAIRKLAASIPSDRCRYSDIFVCDEKVKKQITSLDIERTSISRIRGSTGDGLRCCYIAPRKAALSELVARSGVCAVCRDRRGVRSLRCI